jgi:hypothetical protein
VPPVPPDIKLHFIDEDWKAHKKMKMYDWGEVIAGRWVTGFLASKRKDNPILHVYFEAAKRLFVWYGGDFYDDSLGGDNYHDVLLNFPRMNFNTGNTTVIKSN